MNRHIPNGTYGGVGGRGLAALSYPIHFFLMRLLRPCGARNGHNTQKVELSK